MNEPLTEVYLARHGETAWSLSGQHTGRTDIPLTERGEENARKLRWRLEGITFTEVLVSPLQRARRTCELAGFAAVANVIPDLVEWDYGDYEGRRTAEIRGERPGSEHHELLLICCRKLVFVPDFWYSSFSMPRHHGGSP